jgi:putative oxidoreductase
MNAAAQQDLGKFILRVVLGALILLHGVAKLMHGVGPIEQMLVGHGLPGVLAWGALVGEVLAPVMLIAGFHARIGGVIVVVNMLFALFLVHMSQLAQLNEQGGYALELQAMFLFSALAIALQGPGKYSVNGK